MQLFFSDNIFNGNIILSEDESRHCIKTLRKKIGDTVWVTDGKNTLYQGRLTECEQKKCHIQIVEEKRDYQPSKIDIIVAICPTKNISRLEWFVEKATEIGVARIVPILCKNNERKIIKIDRLKRVMLSAAKQSLTTNFPVLDELTTFEDFLKEPKEGRGLIAYCGDEIEKGQLVSNNIFFDRKTTILIGPEGDFTPEEVQLALQKGYQAISLGDKRLRTETAGIVSVTIANQWGN